jgi:predicted secreted protein
MKITLISTIVTFFSSWWVIFFMILPIGIEQEDNHIQGCDVGAPKAHNIKKKFLITTGITCVLNILFASYMIYG